MLIVSDLDGTLMGRGHGLSQANRESFEKAQQKGAICAIATGRSLKSAEEVLESSFPIDYLIFSSGAGIWNWKTKSLMHHSTLEHPQIIFLHQYFSALNLDYTIQLTAPDSHLFFHTALNNYNPGFTKRVSHHAEFGSPLDFHRLPSQATEFIVIDSSENAAFTHKKIVSEISDRFNVVRATSPLDGYSIWTEIFPQKTSKAFAADWVRNLHQVPLEKTYALGNDYNDLQLLAWAKNSLVVGDAVPELLEKYPATRAHTEDALANAIQEWLGRNG